jgi:hypothetical protein
VYLFLWAVSLPPAELAFDAQHHTVPTKL